MIEIHCIFLKIVLLNATMLNEAKFHHHYYPLQFDEFFFKF